MDQQNRNAIEKIINSRRVQRRFKRIIALMAVFVLLMTTDSLKMLADTMESDTALDSVNVVEAVDAEQALFDEGVPGWEEAEQEEYAAIDDDEAIDDASGEDVALEETLDADAGEEALSMDDVLSTEHAELEAEELTDIAIDEVSGDEAELFVDYEEAEDILYAVNAEGAGFSAEVSCDTGVTLPAGTTLAAQWTENVEGRGGAVAQLCDALGVAGNTLPANMGAAFLDLALLNGGATMQPVGNVYVNIDFTTPLHIEGSNPAFRVVTLIGGAARVIDESNYGVTLEGSDVTALWYHTDTVAETALVWSVAPEAETEAIVEPADEGEDQGAPEEVEEDWIEETTEPAEETETGREAAVEEAPAEETEILEDTHAEDDETGTDDSEAEPADEAEPDVEIPDDGEDEPADEKETVEETPTADETETDGTEDAPVEENETDKATLEEEDDETDEEAGSSDATDAEGEGDSADETDAEGEAADEPEAPSVTVSGAANGINVTITGDVPADAAAAASLMVDGEAHEAFTRAIEDLTDADTAEHALVFDIALIHNNEEIQPNGPVNVTVAFDAPFSVQKDAEAFRLVRVLNDAAELVDVAEIDVVNGALAGFTYTVDELTPVAVIYGASEDILVQEDSEETPEEGETDAEATDEAAAEPLRLGIATVTTAEGEGLPADAEGHADIIDGDDAIAQVKAYLNGGRRAKKAVRSEQPVSETRYTVLDIDVSNADADGYRVNVALPEAIEARDFRLFHIHDDVEEIAVTLYDAEGNEVDPAAASAVAGFSFITETFSPFVLQYTVDITYEDDGAVISIDFTDFDAGDADGGDEAVLTLLNDGVNVNVAALLAGASADSDEEGAQRQYRSLYVGVENADIASEPLEGYAADAVEGELGYAAGMLTVRGNGAVTLSNGERTITINVTGYTELLASMVEGEGVTIDVLEGAVPAGSEATYTEHTVEETEKLVSAYIEAASAEDEAAPEEDAAEPEKGEEAVTGYAAFDVTIHQPEGDPYTEAGSFQVTVEPGIDAGKLVPEGAVLTGVRYKVYHIHDGEATEVAAELVDGKLVFVTDSFSDFIIEYTVDFKYEDGSFDINLNFTGFNAASANRDDEAVLAALDEGLSIDMAKLFETAELEQEDGALKGLYQGVALDVQSEQSYEDIDFASLSQVSAEGGLSYADGRLVIKDDGAIELTDGVYTLRLTVTGYADIIWQIRTLIGEGVTIEVLEGSVPETAEAVCAPYTAEETAELAAQAGIEAGEDARLTGFDVSIMDGEEAFTEAGEYRVSVDLAPEVPENAVVDAVNVVVHHIHDGEATELPAAYEDGKLVFTTDSFSDFLVEYTVDFHWEVNGKMYEFSIPGGGFASFRQLVEVLGIAGDTNSGENEGESDTQEAGVLTLDDLQISDATRQFVSDVASVEFSSPELLSVGKVEENTTVGAIKDGLGLECEYSAELTAEQIAEINAQTVEAGDWALISVQPFTSEESLTVNMKNGDQFEIQVTDGQLHTYVISDSGDTYEIIVTYDDTAEIPDDAKLVVREIKDTEEEYIRNVEATNRELQAQEAPEVVNPVQFDISIVADGVEVEPKEGSLVNVEIRLAPEVFGEMVEDKESSVDSAKSETEEKGEIWFNGAKIEETAVDSAAQFTVSHITDDGKAEIIENVNSSVNEDEKIVLKFETESFSDYLMGNPNGLNVLPSTIRVGDEIYMWERADYYVTNIGSVVDEIKHPNGQYGNDGSDWKTVRAINPGTFRIVHKNDWNNGNPYRNYKEITVLPAITETTPPGTINTVDNASIGLTLNLFDYDLDNYLDDYFNNYNHGNHPIPSNFLNHGINNGHALKFWGSGIGNNYGSANLYQEHGVTSIVQQNLAGGVGGYPQLRADSNPSWSTESLEYLFSTSNGTDKEAYTNVNHLFKKEGDYYVYDSNSNYAYYDKSQGNGGSFAVYERTYKQKSGSESGAVQDKAIGFFPFHKWNEAHDLYVNWNKNLNHHFGMSMSVPFSLPKDPKAVKDSTGQPIVFEFSGDDDLWVFIDGKLAMDIGGIHQPTNGTINFMTGEVTVNGARQTGFDFSGLYDGQKHTLQVFYIERGGCDSNCMIKFNMTQYGDVEFDKVDAEDNTLLLAGAVFGLYKDAACTEPLTEELKTGGRRAFIVETDANGHAKLADVPLGEYYLKEIHAPDGYPIAIGAGTVKVRVYLDANGNVKTSVNGQESDAKILNSKPEKINLGLKKEWQNVDGQTITVPDGVNATFEIKRIRTYETYTEREVQGEEKKTSHLTVGWIHNGQTHVYEEFDLIAGSTATISWSYVDGYEGSKDCIENGVRVDKDYVTGNVVSEALIMPAANGSATFYIIDESENGDAIKSINVAGSQFYGNSGGGFIHEFHTITEPDPGFTYTGTNVTNNQVTLPIDESAWQYEFSNLPSLGRGTVTVDGKQQNVTYKYSYYIEEVSSTAPEGTTVIYKDLNGRVVNSPTDAETHTSGTQTIINKVSTHFSANKSWVNQDGTPATLPAGTSIEFHLYADGNDTGKTVVLNGKTDVAEVTDEETQELNTSTIANGAYENKPWGAYWGNLLRYAKNKDGNWVEIQYTVSEKINAETGFLPEVNGVTEDGGTIKNIRKGAPPDPEIPDPDNTNPEIHKRIDALRDAVGNPDTTLDDDATNDLTDLYRLYLDYKINSVQEPEGVDLLFVIDHSGSMNNDFWEGNSNRAPTVMNVLNGSGGLIDEFLQMNEKNQWAAVGFKGCDGFWRPQGQVPNAGWNNSEVLSAWGRRTSGVSLPNEGANILTDYTAGLFQAEQFLLNEAIKNDGKKKVVIFISDGIPTLFIEGDWISEQEAGTLANVGGKTGSPYYPAAWPTYGCPNQTFRQFKYFVKDMNRAGFTFGENMEFYALGFGDSVLAENGGKALLKNMVNFAYEKDVSSTHFIGIGDGNNSAELLKKALRQIIGASESFSNLVIQDDLSQYVDLYGITTAGNDSAAILRAASTKVTMTDPTDTSKVKVLYQNGSITADGENILKSVSYDPATKTVKAEFKDGYKAEPGIRYTLSFDVKATEKAYSDFASGGYNSTGDEDTDFKGTNPPNATSSGKPGFHSNDSAKATYKHNDTPKEKTYKHPVVQVFPKIRVVKEDQTGSLLEGATFELYKEGYDPAKTSQENAEFKLKEMVSRKENVDSTDALIYEDVLKPGTYYLVETKAPDGYTLLEAPVKIEVTEAQETGAITVKVSIAGTEISYPKLVKDIQSGNWKLIVVNESGIALPNTGGPGTNAIYATGAGLMVLAVIWFIWDQRRRYHRADI